MRKPNLLHLAQTPLLLAIAALLSLAASACSPAPRLPDGARSALEQAWNAIPAGAGELHIVRAWPGKASPKELTPWAPETETWCVEVELPATLGIATPSELAIWVVSRPDEKSEWAAGMLLTMSSLWPYQACGLTP